MFLHALLVVVEPPGAAVLEFPRRLRPLECPNEGIDPGVVRRIQAVEHCLGQAALLLQQVHQPVGGAATVRDGHRVEPGVRP